MITPMQPGVYQLRHDTKEGYFLEYSKPRFNILGKNYGPMDKQLDLFWKRYISLKTVWALC